MVVRNQCMQRTSTQSAPCLGECCILRAWNAPEGARVAHTYVRREPACIRHLNFAPTCVVDDTGVRAHAVDPPLQAPDQESNSRSGLGCALSDSATPDLMEKTQA